MKPAAAARPQRVNPGKRKAVVMAAPRTGELLPDFTLTESEGERVRISDFRGHRNLVLVLATDCDDEVCAPFLAALTHRERELRQESAQVLVLLQCSVGTAREIKAREELPFPVLADEDGRVHRTFGVSVEGKRALMVYVADRFGEIFSIQRGEGALPLPAAKEILEWLAFINRQGPECGVPHWPM